MEFSACFSGKIKNGILTGPKGSFKIPYTLQNMRIYPADGAAQVARQIS